MVNIRKLIIKISQHIERLDPIEFANFQALFRAKVVNDAKWVTRTVEDAIAAEAAIISAGKKLNELDQQLAERRKTEPWLKSDTPEELKLHQKIRHDDVMAAAEILGIEPE